MKENIHLNLHHVREFLTSVNKYASKSCACVTFFPSSSHVGAACLCRGTLKFHFEPKLMNLYPLIHSFTSCTSGWTEGKSGYTPLRLSSIAPYQNTIFSFHVSERRCPVLISRLTFPAVYFGASVLLSSCSCKLSLKELI